MKVCVIYIIYKNHHFRAFILYIYIMIIYKYV